MPSTPPDLELEPTGLPRTSQSFIQSADAGTPDWACRRAKRAAWAAFAVLILYVGFKLTPVGSSLDQNMRTARDDSGTVLLSLSRDLLGAINPLTAAAATMALTVLAWRRRGWVSGAEIGFGTSVALGLAESMKTLLPTLSYRPGSHLVVGGSFPSGHVAVTTALVLAVITVTGPRLMRVLWFPVVTLPAVTAAATIAVGWHRPSDAIGGVLTAVVAHHGVRALTARRRKTSSAGTAMASEELAARSGPHRQAPSAPVRRRTNVAGQARTVVFSSGALLAAAYLMLVSRPQGSPESWHEPGVWLYAGALGAVLVTAQTLMTFEVRDP